MPAIVERRVLYVTLLNMKILPGSAPDAVCQALLTASMSILHVRTMKISEYSATIAFGR